MIENVAKSTERGEKIQFVMDRSDSLVATSNTYKRRARQVRVAQRNKRIAMIFCGIGLALVSDRIAIFAN